MEKEKFYRIEELLRRFRPMSENQPELLELYDLVDDLNIEIEGLQVAVEELQDMAYAIRPKPGAPPEAKECAETWKEVAEKLEEKIGGMESELSDYAETVEKLRARSIKTEDLYWEIWKLHTVINNHGWSKRMTREDADIIVNVLKKGLVKIANEFYRILHPEEKMVR